MWSENSSVLSKVTEVANRHGIALSVIMSAARTRSVVKARHELMAELRALGLSLPEIGRVVGRDHTTVMHALRKGAA